MDRLTGRNEKGDLLVNEKVVYAGNFYEVASKLEEYEDLEESLEKTYGKCDGLLEMTVKYLAEHEGAMAEKPKKSILLTDEDAEKWQRWKASEAAGRLIDLPCKPGDTVYAIVDDCGFNGDCHQTQTCNSCEYRDLYVEDYIATLKFIVENIDKFGKTVFLTEHEAMEVLEGMKK